MNTKIVVLEERTYWCGKQHEMSYVYRFDSSRVTGHMGGGVYHNINDVPQPYRTMMQLLRTVVDKHGVAEIEGMGRLRLGEYKRIDTMLKHQRVYTLVPAQECSILEGLR